MTQLNNFIEMLDSQRIVYNRYDRNTIIEIAMPCNDGWHCFDFNTDGSLDSVWDRNYDYVDIV